MTGTAITHAPTGLGLQGRAVWNEVVAGYRLRPDERRILEDACREIDLIERMELAIRSAELEVSGSKGQVAVHPLFSEVRQHRQLLKTLLGALRLPDEDASGVHGATGAARSLALVRWRRSS